MHRLFVAIRPPAPLRAQLLAAMGGMEDARWQDDDQLHLTLRFIGEVDGHTAEDAALALERVHHPGFAIALAGAGCFDRKGRVDTLWAGIRPSEPLTALHRKIDRALVTIGLEPERRAYLPHITLARLGRAAGPVEPALAGLAGLASAPHPVSDFRLYESHLTRDGGSYEAIARYPLA